MEKTRKSRKAEILYEKRFYKYFTVQSYLEEANDDPQEIQKILDDVPVIAKDMSSGVFELQYAAIYKMKFIIVTQEYDDAMHVLVEREIISHLLRFLESGDGNVKIAGAEVLHKVINGSPEYALQVIDHGGAATLVWLLGSSHSRVKVEAMRAMACASTLPLQYRDALIANGAITQLTAMLELLLNTDDGPERTSSLHNTLKALKGLCSGDPAPRVHQAEIIAPIVQRTLIGVNPLGLFFDICKDACLVLFYLLRALTSDQVQEIGNAELSQRLIWLMQNTDQEVVEAVHRILRRLILSSQNLVQVLIDHEILPALNHNLNQVPSYQLLACRTIKVMIDSNRTRIQILFDGNLIQPLFQIIQDEEVDEAELKMEAILVLSKAARRGTDAQIGGNR